LRRIQIPFKKTWLWGFSQVVKQTSGHGFAGKSTLNRIIFWLARQEKAVVLGSCNLAIYIDV
jgi:hypothetical protein